MDSLSQIGLGAAVSIAALGPRSAAWKAALWGAVAGTLPDLDVLIDQGDPIANMVAHRSESHAVFWLTLLSLPLAAAIARLHHEQALWRRWWLAIWLALVTHPLLDAMTVYGTRLALPFSDTPFGVGSVFIIDPLFTLPVLAGTGWALASRGSRRGLAANAAGLLLGCAYLGWGAAVQQQVEHIARTSLAEEGLAAERLLVTPTAFNSLLWRIVVMQDEHYLEGFRSLLDTGAHVHFDRFERGRAFEAPLRGVVGAQDIAAFSRGFYKLHARGDELLVTDLRMGQEPTYTFSFVVAERHSALAPRLPPQAAGRRPELGPALSWLWRRALGEPLPPPR